MKKLVSQIILFFVSVLCYSQVGINTTLPNAQLEIASSNQATPANTDGIIIPKIDAFPLTNPTIAQEGMLVYLTTTVGLNTPGFYYWDTTTWKAVTPPSTTISLDQAYDAGGAGLGRTITADAGAVQINGTDGFVSNGTFGAGATAPSGAGTKMFWNPRKGAFRAGTVTNTQWDDTSVGSYSTAFGLNTTASGTGSSAFGTYCFASGGTSTAFGNLSSATNNSTAFGHYNVASGNSSTAFGYNTTASGGYSTSLGNNTTASGSFSTALGYENFAPSYGETVIGSGATTYVPSLDGDFTFDTPNLSDRIFCIGNGYDNNIDGTISVTERSDAMVVLKSGNIGIGTSTPNTTLDIRKPNKITTDMTSGNLNIVSNNALSSNMGGSITLGGVYNNTGTHRVFGSIEGRKTNAINLDSSGYLQFKTNSLGTLSERMRITDTGNVGIGITNPGGQFELSLNQGRKPGSTSWTVVSDKRLKTINGKYTKGLSEILKLNPILYNYKNGSRTFEKEVIETEFSGFIAQEVQSIFPEAVGTDADGFLNFNMHPILIAQVNATKQLYEKNNELEKENIDLKKELLDQKNQLLFILERVKLLENKK